MSAKIDIVSNVPEQSGGWVRETDHPLVRGLTDADRTRLFAGAVRRTYPPRATVFTQGDRPDGLHLVLDGHAAVSATTPEGDEVTFAVVGAGGLFGEMAIVGDDDRRSGSVRSWDVLTTVLVPTPELARLRREQPAIDDLLLSVLAERIRRLSDHLLEALHVPAEKRVVRRLIVLCRLYEAANAVGDAVRVPIAQVDLAGLAGTTRQTVNKTLRLIEADGGLQLSRAAITVVDRRALARYAR